MKNNQKMTLLFWHRKSKPNAKGFAPVICRISIEGEQEAELSIGKNVHIENWDIENKRAVAGAEARDANAKIDEVSVDLKRLFLKMQFDCQCITPLMLKNDYKGISTVKSITLPLQAVPAVTAPTLLEVADLQVSNFKKLVDIGKRSPETLKQWKATRKKIEEFLIYSYSCRDYNLADVELSFAADFYEYLTVEREKVLGEAAAKKQVKNTKQIITLAASKRWLPSNPIEKFKCGGDETDVQPLEFFQINQLWIKNMHIKRLEEVRDVFIFQCFTGFAYQDVYALTPEHIVRVGLTGERWLVKARGKTQVTEMMPIMPIVDEIITKYENHTCRKLDGLLLPVDSNARYNAYLKEIAVIAGISRELNTHLARHSFADMMLNIFGFSLEEVSRMLGHKTIRTTQRYAKVRKNKISQTWAKVKGVMFTDDGQLRRMTT